MMMMNMTTTTMTKTVVVVVKLRKIICEDGRLMVFPLGHIQWQAL
jgi:hypothetical protein